MSTSRDRSYDAKKFEDLVRYVCHKMSSDDLGTTKLNKILWEADREAYLRTGSSITGARYIRRQYGPVPSPIVHVLRELQEKGLLTSETVDYRGGTKKVEFECRDAPDMGDFSGEELQLIDSIINRAAFETAKFMTDRSHTGAWERRQDGEQIPHHAWLVDYWRQPRADELEWARSQVPT